MKVKVRRSIRFKRWIRRAGKKFIGHLVPILISILIMLVVIDIFTIYSSHQSARDIATRAAVVAHQTLEQDGNRSLAEKQAFALIERNLAKFEGIEFRDGDVEVTIIYKARSMILKYIPWVKKLTIITASGSHPQ